MTRNRYYTGPPSDHFDGVRFFNAGQVTTDRGLSDILRWKLGERAAPWPATVAVDQAKPAAHVDGIRITMIGHASLLIQVAGVNILTDPVWSERASPFRFVGPRRVTAPGIAFDDLPPIHVVLLSHCHYDHMDVATLRRLQWDRLPIAEGISTTLTPANHWANRWPSDVRMALWAGHYVSTPVGSIWFVGDTGFGDGRIFADVRARLGPPDVALIPIGAYAPRWFMAEQHVDPAEAVRIFRDVGAGHALGMHWGTFRLTDEARVAPRQALADALSAADIAPDRFVAAEAGGVYDFTDAGRDEPLTPPFAPIPC